MTDYTVKRCLDKASDLPLPPHDHTENAGHDTTDRDGGVLGTFPVIHNGLAVFQGKHAGEIDSHQIIFLGAQVCGGGEIVIFR